MKAVRWGGRKRRTACPEPVCEASGACPEPSEAVRTASENVREIYGIRTKSDRTVRDWMETFPEVEKSERGRPLKRMVMGGAAVMSVLAVYARYPPRVIIVFTTAAVASAVGFNAFGMFGRTLADYSRYLIAAALLIWSVAAVRPTPEALAVAGVLSALTLVLVKAYNLHWLSAQVYKRSPTVRKALAKTQPEDVTNLWQLTGSRMVRTLAWELGLKVDEMEGRLLRGTWLIGYTTGSRFVEEAALENSRLAKENTGLHAEIAALHKELEEAEDFVENRKDYEAELAGVKEELRNKESDLLKARAESRENLIRSVDQGETIERMKSEAARREERIAELEAELTEANEQLSQLTPITPIGATTDKEKVARVLREAYDANLSIREAAKMAGCSKFKAETFWKEQKAAAAGA